MSTHTMMASYAFKEGNQHLIISSPLDITPLRIDLRLAWSQQDHHLGCIRQQELGLDN